MGRADVLKDALQFIWIWVIWRIYLSFPLSPHQAVSYLFMSYTEEKQRHDVPTQTAFLWGCKVQSISKDKEIHKDVWCCRINHFSNGRLMLITLTEKEMSDFLSWFLNHFEHLVFTQYLLQTSKLTPTWPQEHVLSELYWKHHGAIIPFIWTEQ